MANMLTKKGKYGLKAMIYLASNPNETPLSVQDIAHARKIPRKFLDNIFLELKHAGLVESKKGRGGGFYLAKSADAISAGEIVRILDGPLAPIRCASKSRYQPCNDCNESICAVRLLMGEVREAIAAVLDHTTLATLCNKEETLLPL